MLESLQTSTMVTGYGILASPVTTSSSGIKTIKDKEGNVESLDVNAFKTTLGSVASSATTTSYFHQEASYQQTLEEVRNAQAYVESLDDEKLAQLTAMLEEKELTFEIDENADAKRPYSKI